MANQAESHYQHVKRALQTLQTKLGQGDRISHQWPAYFAESEKIIEKLRLVCMATIFEDLKYSHEKNVENSLWHAHSSINTKYRKALRQLKGSKPEATLHKVERLYSNHLKTAQYFYKGFIQRLSALYELVDLQRIARCLEDKPVQLKETVDARGANLESEVTASCYNTLLHLGDLARYRNQSRHKNSSLDIALAYYGLAQDVRPTAGDAHHQMAVLYIPEDQRDFEIVYRFYRAIVVERPHPNAFDNLKQEFRNLLPSSPQKGGNAALDPRRTFASWFTRLHARFYQGEVFSQQDELETEVLHRFELMLKDARASEILLQAVLINICAYHVALKKTKDQWTIGASQSSQFILRFNIRILTILSQVVDQQLQKARGNATHPNATTQRKADGVTEAKAADISLHSALSLIRLYIAWVYTYRADIVEYQQYLEPFVSDMHKSLTSCLSSATKVVLEAEAKALPYLLPEDVEALGVVALNGWNRLQLNVANELKPRSDEWPPGRETEANEDLARLYDLLICGCHLVKDANFPYIEIYVQENGQEWATFVYVEDYHSSFGSVQASSSAASAAAMGPNVKDLTTEFDGLAASPLPIAGHSGAVAQGEGNAAPQNPYTAADYVQPDEITQDVVDDDLNIDAETYNRLNDFLAPPETNRGQTPTKQTETSYDMHTSTANEVFRGAGQSSPSGRTGFTKPIPRLPWELGFTSTSYRPFQQDSAARLSQGEISRTAAQDDGSVWTQSLSDGSLVQPQAHMPSPKDPFTTPVRNGLAFQQFPSWKPQSRNLGDGQAGAATSAQHLGLGAQSDLFGSFPNVSREGSGSRARLGGSGGHLPAFQGRTTRDLLLESGDNRFPASIQFTANSSSLPSVNSPRGLPTAVQQPHVGHYEPYAYQVAPESPDHLTEAGQLNVGGKWFNATTAWGRGPPTGKDDPTHFRNTLKDSQLMMGSRAYDQAALYSALSDGQQQRQPGV